MRHLSVLLAALALMGLVLGVAAGVSSSAALDRMRVTAFFAPGTSPSEMLQRVALADGRIVRGTLLPFAVEVAADAPGIASRLRAAGAWFVITELPSHALALGGCSYLPASAYPPRLGLQGL